MGDNVVVSNMELEKLLSMKGGKGEGSYANNSQAQVLFILSLHLLLSPFSSILYQQNEPSNKYFLHLLHTLKLRF